MSNVFDQAIFNRDMRRASLLRESAVMAAEFRVQTWMLADSLDWAIDVLMRSSGTGDGLSEDDLAQFQVAQVRIKQATKALRDSGTGEER